MRKKILVIDDDDGILDAIRLILENEGYTVETTTKGEQTYTKVLEFSPDLIILDVLMSGNDGRHICQNLKADTQVNHIPILMISAHPSAEKSIKECGADGYLAKPFETAMLLSCVSRYMKK